MAKLDQNSIEEILIHLEKVKVFTTPEVATLLECSEGSVRALQKKWNTFTSYNQNGRFYVLPHIPKFDQYGLWHHENASFSQNGNLKKTIVHLVETSPAGLTGRELGEILGLLPQSFVHHYSKQPGIIRTRLAGSYVHFSSDTAVYESQIQNRNKLISEAVVITDSEAIMILVAIINSQSISAEEIIALPEIKKINITLTAIQRFIESHNLEKKTSD